jgi:hypothetical protein
MRAPSISAPSRGQLVSTGAGALLAVVLFLPWYGVDVGMDMNATADAWKAFGGVDLVLFAIAIAAIVTPAVRGWPRGTVVACLGALAVALVVARIIDPPHGLGLRYGAPLGLLAAAGVLAGGWLLLREES